jgi:hypothetical protein
LICRIRSDERDQDRKDLHKLDQLSISPKKISQLIDEAQLLVPVDTSEAILDIQGEGNNSVITQSSIEKEQGDVSSLPTGQPNMVSQKVLGDVAAENNILRSISLHLMVVVVLHIAIESMH